MPNKRNTGRGNCVMEKHLLWVPCHSPKKALRKQCVSINTAR